MSGEIKKIDSIRNMAVFLDFRWDAAVRDEKNNVAELKEINILYGRNYSGKTTLSRILRALETGSISSNYNFPEFQLSFGSGSKVTQNSLTNHGQVIRVFNEDFVKDNLRFIVDDTQPINSFAILGEDNAKLEGEISKHEGELGNEENKSGLLGELHDVKNKFNEAQQAHTKRLKELNSKLFDKANKENTGIKHNKQYGNSNYNVEKLKADISCVFNVAYSPLTNEQVSEYNALLRDEPKKEIPESTLFNLKYSAIVSKAKELIEKKIQLSDPIQELLNDNALATWVRAGRDTHKGKRDKCAFCGSDLPQGLWEKLDKHFNQESEELRSSLNNLLTSITRERERVPNLLKINTSEFYSTFTSELASLEEQFRTYSARYCASLDSIKEQIEERKDKIFTPLIFHEPKSVESALNAVRDSLEVIRNKSNGRTASLSAEQSKARDSLRLHEVYTFAKEINYEGESKAISALNEDKEKAEEVKNTTIRKVETLRAKISGLKAKLKDESKGADRVNYYLNNFFGHQSLSLKAIEAKQLGTSSGYRFEVIRNDKKAFHLSEGECSLIAFCYFVARLQDIETKDKQPIIWIDDPISSLDANHIFFVYSLINAEIVEPEKYDVGAEKKERDRFKQLFISTHNLDFLKYLKRLPGAHKDVQEKEDKKKYRYLLIERQAKGSTIKLMPNYLRKYVTEFNYLFEQIYRCATLDEIDDNNYTTFYNFSNNARKFLELYLYYRYPNEGMTKKTLKSFFGEENIPAVLVDRINNEYSHLAGTFERGALPVVVPEMHKSAKLILKYLQEKDRDQYSALLQSIGATE